MLLTLSIHPSQPFTFTLPGASTKLLTWLGDDGFEQKLLLTQTSVQERTVLVEKTVLPYEYVVD